MPIHEELWKAWKLTSPDDPVLRAVRFLFRSNFGFLGKPQTLKWNNRTAKRRIQENIALTREALYDVEFMCCDFRNMLRRIPMSKGEASRAFVYADPPYLGTANNYGEAGDWNIQDTRDLFAELANSGLRFGISEFDGPVIQYLAKEHGLRVITIGERHNLRNRRTEVLIVNK
jgi:DNA adenine methylase